MDRAKTLTQLPGGKYGSNMADALRKVCEQEGVRGGLYRGLPVAMVREASKNMFRIGLFAPILRVLHPDPDHDGPAPAWKRFAAGTLTGALGAVASNPFDLVKTRMQVPAAMSAYASALPAFRDIARREGLGTFYRGVGASVARDMLGSSVNLTTQSMASEWFVKNHLLTPGSPALGAISGILSAAAAVAVMQPIDTSRAYVYLKPHLHRDTLHAARFIVMREGPMSLYRGSRAHFLRTAPHYALMFALLEAITGCERGVIHRRNRDMVDRVPIFDDLPKSHKDKLAHGVRVVGFKRGDVVFREGDEGGENPAMYFVLGGKARAFKGRGAARTTPEDENDSEATFDGVDDGCSGAFLASAREAFTRATTRGARRRRPGARCAVASGEASAGSTAASVDALGDADSDALLGAGDYFGEEALLVDEPREASVSVTSASASFLVVDRVAYESATRGGPDTLFHKRTNAVRDVEAAWRRLRFEREMAKVPLLAELSLYERSLLAKQCARTTFDAGAKIMREGDPGDMFYILLHGSAVAVTRDEEAGANGAEGRAGNDGARGGGETSSAAPAPHRVVRSYGPGAHFGELALLTGRPRSATVVAEERCVALVLEKDALLGLRSAVPTLEDHIVRGMRHYDHIEQFTSMAMA
jgi:cAMP-dependent protein kinase regulator